LTQQNCTAMIRILTFSSLAFLLCLLACKKSDLIIKDNIQDESFFERDQNLADFFIKVNRSNGSETFYD